MRIILIVLFIFDINRMNCDKFSSTLGHLKPSASPDTQADAVQNLIKRIIPVRASKFVVKVDPDLNKDSVEDTFRIEKISNGNIQITANTGVAAATAFNYYLKYFCNCHISWEASQLNLPEELPDVNITVTLNDRFRYYQNVCTTSYSFVWWDWNQWEKHIDWMALNSFNLVLAFNGQEAIWERVYQKFNFTSDDIDEHFTGPAFLSWLRMGNIRGWGGPLSQAWHTRSIILQKQILKRMRDLGMIPVLPAFAGHVPVAFKRLYPEANMIRMGMMMSWSSFNDTYCCPYFLDPTEKLFNEIGKTFVAELIAEFGTDHVYNCDSFNENKPRSEDLTYLANVGKSVYKAMTDSDPDAVWLMQNWIFVSDGYFWTKERAKAFLTAVPIGKMIVLDLQSEVSPKYEVMEQYFGQPYIWCMLHNFGGTLGMFGSSSTINEEPIRARNLVNSTMVGTGLTPEGINQNYVIYELMTETAWRSTPTNLTEWFENYATRRYGMSDTNAKAAWRILQRTIYNLGRTRLMGQYPIMQSPSLSISSVWRWYTICDLEEAWTSLLAAGDNLRNNSSYLHDLVDVTRQILQDKCSVYYIDLIYAFKTKDIPIFQSKSKTFLEIFSDLEAILSTNVDFLLGPWLANAKNAANNTEEEQQYEYNARNQITVWGPNGNMMDYGGKQWSGVVSNYFAPRWRMFIEYMNEILVTGQEFDQAFIKNKIFKEVEEPFTFDRTQFPVEPTGDTVEVARSIYKKWLPRKL